MTALAKMRKAHRKAIELLYEGTCTITIYEPYLKPNKATGHREIIVLENEPCRLSYSSAPPAVRCDSNPASHRFG